MLDKRHLHSYDDPKRSDTSRRSRSRVGPAVRPGTYLAKLTVDGETYEETIRVEADPDLPAGMLPEELTEYEAKERAGFVE